MFRDLNLEAERRTLRAVFIHFAVRAMWVLGLCALLAPASAAAASKDRPNVALFPLIAARGVDVSTASAIERRLLEAAEHFDGLRLLHGKLLRKKLRKNPTAVVGKCERKRRFAACFAKLARRLGVRELILARAAPDSGGTKVVILAIKPTKIVEPRGSLYFETADAVYQQLGMEALAAVYNREPPIAVAEAEPEDVTEPEADYASEPPAGMVDDDALAMADPEPYADPYADPYAEPVDETGTSPSDPILMPDSVTSQTEAMTAVPGELSNGPDLTRNVPPAKAASNPALRWTGVTLAIIGAGAVGAGGYFGWDSSNIRENVTRDGTMNQREGLAAFETANQSAELANILFIAGGAAVAVGATLFGIDLAL